MDITITQLPNYDRVLSNGERTLEVRCVPNGEDGYGYAVYEDGQALTGRPFLGYRDTMDTARFMLGGLAAIVDDYLRRG